LISKLISTALSVAIVLGLTVAVLKAQLPPSLKTQHANVDASIYAYRPQMAAPPRGAGYVLPDGSIQIVGFDDMDGILESVNALFVQSHPGIKIKNIKGNKLQRPWRR